MINNLIQAYRAEFYDFSPADIWSIVKSNWRILLIPVLVFFLIVVLIFCFVYFNLHFLVYCAAFLEFILCVVADRYLVKQYQGIMHNRALHLEKVKSFLENIYPEHSLFTNSQIDTLIARLTEHIQAHQPFKSLVEKLGNFAKAIVLPVIAFIAGLYSSEMKSLGVSNVVTIAAAIITLLAMGYIFWLFVSFALRRIIFRDYDAAEALREDLRDIQLLFFSSVKHAKQE